MKKIEKIRAAYDALVELEMPYQAIELVAQNYAKEKLEYFGIADVAYELALDYENIARSARSLENIDTRIDELRETLKGHNIHHVTLSKNFWLISNITNDTLELVNCSRTSIADGSQYFYCDSHRLQNLIFPDYKCEYGTRYEYFGDYKVKIYKNGKVKAQGDFAYLFRIYKEVQELGGRNYFLDLQREVNR